MFARHLAGFAVASLVALAALIPAARADRPGRTLTDAEAALRVGGQVSNDRCCGTKSNCVADAPIACSAFTQKIDCTSVFNVEDSSNNNESC
jgi:hypothetical protein